MLVEVERQELGQEREPLGARQVRRLTSRRAVDAGLEQRAYEFLEHRGSKRGLRLLPLVHQDCRLFCLAISISRSRSELVAYRQAPLPRP